jgi:hypothetical protein
VLASMKKSRFFMLKLLFFVLASMKKSRFFTLKLLFFTLELVFFHSGEKAGFGRSAVEGSLINLLRTLYVQG